MTSLVKVGLTATGHEGEAFAHAFKNLYLRPTLELKTSY